MNIYLIKTDKMSNTSKFEKLFQNYSLFSQAWKDNPLVIVKIEIKEEILYLLEYSSKNKTAFWYSKNIKSEEWELLYVYIPQLQWLKINKMKSIYLNDIINIEKIKQGLLNR